MARFHLSRATPADVPEMISIIGQLADEDNVFREYFIGPNTAEQRDRNATGYQTMMANNAQQFWLKVTEQSTGKIVGGSMWKIHPTVIPEVTLDSRQRPWLDNDPEVRQRVMQTVEEQFATRRRLYTQPHIQVGLIFTDRAHRRQGAGALMMQWAIHLADLLFLPIWVESVPGGKKLYQHFGFEAHHTGLATGDFMKREAKSHRG